MTEVYLEAGKRRVFACAPEWPGWCRPGRDEEAGPRGGGRDRDAIVAHVRETEVLHARMLGLKERPFPAEDVGAAGRVRAGILAEIRASAAARPPEGLARPRRPARFVARRTAWHALDHAWEIQDKSDP